MCVCIYTCILKHILKHIYMYLCSHMTLPAPLHTHTSKVQEMLEDGRITSVVDKREFVGVDTVADAVEYMLSGAALGKVVVRM